MGQGCLTSRKLPCLFLLRVYLRATLWMSACQELKLSKALNKEHSESRGTLKP